MSIFGIDHIIELAKKESASIRNRYIKYLTIVNSFIKRNNIAVGGKLGLDIILEKDQDFMDFIPLTFYKRNALKSSNMLINELFELTANPYLILYMKKEDREFHILLEGIRFLTFYNVSVPIETIKRDLPVPPHSFFLEEYYRKLLSFDKDDEIIEESLLKHLSIKDEIHKPIIDLNCISASTNKILITCGFDETKLTVPFQVEDAIFYGLGAEKYLVKKYTVNNELALVDFSNLNIPLRYNGNEFMYEESMYLKLICYRILKDRYFISDIFVRSWKDTHIGYIGNYNGFERSKKQTYQPYTYKENTGKLRQI